MDELRFEYEVTRRRWEEEQEMLKSDPAYEEWLDSLTANEIRKGEGNASTKERK